jgi:uncharacterized protein (TIGR00730 family)|tara:strand:+ start:3030 stop:3641 length:612 start_codon:yes stop_codon:yes gene_type:complete
MSDQKNPSNNIKNICVFAGSSFGNREIYKQSAQLLAKQIVINGYNIVFGGGSNGLMGVLADSAIEHDGYIIGIITEQLNDIEVGHPGLNEMVIVDTMHERKKLMSEKSDAIICLPGGVGTWEEFFESLTWNQLGLQSKPIILLNIENYYSTLKDFVEHAVHEGFLPRSTSNELIFANSIDEAMDLVDNFIPQDKSKWFERLKK